MFSFFFLIISIELLYMCVCKEVHFNDKSSEFDFYISLYAEHQYMGLSRLFLCVYVCLFNVRQTFSKIY